MLTLQLDRAFNRVRGTWYFDQMGGFDNAFLDTVSLGSFAELFAASPPCAHDIYEGLLFGAGLTELSTDSYLCSGNSVRCTPIDQQVVVPETSLDAPENTLVWEWCESSGGSNEHFAVRDIQLEVYVPCL